MSNIILNAIAFSEADKRLKALIEDYNDPGLTPRGKKEVLRNCIAFAIIFGFNLSDKEINLVDSAKPSPENNSEAQS